MLQESQFLEMLKEIETAVAIKHKATEDIQEIHERYGLSSAGYRVRKATALEKDPSLEKYIFNKELWRKR